MNDDIDIRKCKIAFRWVNITLAVWFIPMMLIMFTIVPHEGIFYNLALGVHLIGALALLTSLGLLAAFSNHNWVRFGLLPILIPIVGPITSYVVIRRVGKQAGWL